MLRYYLRRLVHKMCAFNNRVQPIGDNEKKLILFLSMHFYYSLKATIYNTPEIRINLSNLTFQNRSGRLGGRSTKKDKIYIPHLR